jgi:hypothetical protein
VLDARARRAQLFEDVGLAHRIEERRAGNLDALSITTPLWASARVGVHGIDNGADHGRIT